MENEETETYAAFAGAKRIAQGALAEVALAAKRMENEGVLVFNGSSGKIVDLDLRGSDAEIAARYAPPAPPIAGRGRPKLGVTAREVTLLPRHWEWLAAQPGGASVALRKLVEAARKSDAGLTRTRMEAAYRFMSAIAGDLAGFEEASRALFAGDQSKLRAHMKDWAPDIGAQVLCYLGGSAP